MEQEQQIFKLHSEYQPTGDQPQAIADAGEGGFRKAISLKPCSVLPAPARRLRWRM